MSAASLGSGPGHARDPLRPPDAPGMGRGFVFAIAAHVLLVLALSSGVHWRTKALPTFEAELWSAVPQAAAPKEVLLPPPPAAEPRPVPRPDPRPEPPAPKVEDLQAQRDAEIAIDKARALKVKRELERLAEVETKRKKQVAEDKAKADKLAEKLAEKLTEKRSTDDKQKKLDKLKQDKLDKQDRAEQDSDARREAQRQDNLRRIQGMAGASGEANASGSALKSAGPSASYGGRIKARIRPNIIYTDSGTGNPVAEVEVRAAPDGSIISKKLIKPSGDAEWDKAVLRAIDKTETLPRDTDGRVPSLLVISFQPRE